MDEGFCRDRPGLRPGAYVKLLVADTGVGMDAHVRAHLFEPFFTTKGPDRGTGLGLATVYGIVKQSGGWIGVESGPGAGATFTIYFPRVDATPERFEESPPGPVPNGDETLLLVEDNADVRTLSRDVLEEHGYRVLEAAPPAEALAMRARYVGPIDLLITDVVMPGMSGRELARRLAAASPGIRVLYMSGYTDDAIVQHGALDPGIMLLRKPFGPDGLARKVRTVLDSQAGAV